MAFVIIRMEQLWTLSNMNIALKIAASYFLLSSTLPAWAESLPLDRPTIPLNLTTKQLPFSQWVLRETNTPLLLEQSSPEVERLSEVYAQAQSSVEDERKKNKSVSITTLENLLSASTQLIEIFEDIKLEKYQNRNLSIDEQKILQEVRKTKINTLDNLLKMSKEKVSLAKYRFQMAALNPISPDSKKVFAKLLTESNVSASIKNRAKAQLLISALNSREIIANEATLKKLIDANKSLFNDNYIATKIALRLAATRALAGISEARPVRNLNPEFRKYLAATLEATTGIDKKYRDAVVMELIWIWRTVDPKASWTQVPIDSKILSKMAIYPAFLERQALELAEKSNYSEAIRMTRQLEDLSQNKGVMRLRLLGWHAIIWKKTGSYNLYETEIVRQYDIEKEANTRRQAMGHYQSLVNSEFISTITNPNLGKKTIALADRFLSKTNPAPELKSSFLEKTASTFLAMKDYKSAGRRYAMAGDSAPAKPSKIRLYRLATTSQTNPARWSDQPPWFKNQGQEVKEERELLFKYYSTIYALSPESWFDLAHIGLLRINLGDQNAAFKLWESQVRKDPRGIHANNAAWTMILEYEKQKRWEELEGLARALDGFRLNPKANGISINSNDKLAYALYQGGLLAYQQKLFDKAVIKLSEYVDKWSKPDEDQALWILALSLKSAGKSMDAVNRTLDLVTRFKNSSHYMLANMTGFDWSEDMALESAMLIFGNNYLTRDKNSAKAMSIRSRQIDLYMGLERYADALARLSDQITSYKTNRLDEIELLYKIMHIQSRFGNPNNASLAADALLAKSRVAWHRAEAFGIKAVQLESKKDVNGISKIEKQVSDLKGEGFIFSQKIAQMRLRIAQSISTQDLLKPVVTISLKNPLKTIQEKFESFNQYDKKIRLVCAPGRTGYCALALISLSRVAREFLKVIEEVSINPDLSDDETKPFLQYKDAGIQKLKNLISSSEKEAYSIVTNGETDPATALDVMSMVSNDWNFEPITGSEGKGFVKLQFQKGNQK